jgi:hypothetical protein
MKASDVVVQAAVGLLIGAGVGAVVGFVTFAFVEMLHPSGGGLMILMPSGPLGVGILGAIMMGLVGAVIGLTIGALSLRVTWAAGLGILIFLLLKARSIYNDFDRRQSFMGLAELLLLLNLVIIGFLVALILRQLFAGRGRYL